MSERSRTVPACVIITHVPAPNEQQRTLLGAEVRRSRKLRNWTLSELASRTGISRKTIGRVENGQLNPSEATLQAIELAYHWPLGTCDAIARGAKNPDGGERAVTVAPIETTGPGQVSDDDYYVSVLDALRVIDNFKQGRLGPAIDARAISALLQQMIEGARQRGKQDMVEMLQAQLRRAVD